MENEFISKGTTPDGKSLWVDSMPVSLATHVRLNLMGGVPVLEFVCVSLATPDGSAIAADTPIAIDQVKPIAKIALAHSAFAMLEAIMREVTAKIEEVQK